MGGMEDNFVPHFLFFYFFIFLFLCLTFGTKRVHLIFFIFFIFFILFYYFIPFHLCGALFPPVVSLCLSVVSYFSSSPFPLRSDELKKKLELTEYFSFVVLLLLQYHQFISIVEFPETILVIKDKSE